MVIINNKGTQAPLSVNEMTGEGQVVSVKRPHKFYYLYKQPNPMKNLITTCLALLIVSSTFGQEKLKCARAEVSYESGMKAEAESACSFIDSKLTAVTEVMGYPTPSMMTIHIYSSDSGSDSKADVNTVFTGNDEDKKKLLFQVTDHLLKEMMNVDAKTNPSWFRTGAAMYISGLWEEGATDYAIGSGKINLKKLNDEEIAVIGPSIWNYISVQYGEENIAKILNYHRIIKNEEKSIEITLGVPFDQLLTDWREFVQL